MKKVFLLLIAVTGFVMAAFFALTVYFFLEYHIVNRLPPPNAKARLSAAQLAEKKAAWKKLKSALAGEMRGFDGKVGLVVKDLSMNWEINSGKDISMPSASIVKVPVMMAYYQAAEEGKMDLGTRIRLNKRDKVSGAGPLKEAPDGSMYNIEELIIPMVTESDNTAANLLIGAMGFDTLTAYFRKMGLKDTNIVRLMMDFKQRSRGVENYTTAADMAHLFEMLYRGRFLNIPASRKCLSILASQKVNDRIPKYLPESTRSAHKTGLENGICHDVGIVYTPKGAYLICVLTQHKYKNARNSKQLIAGMSLLVYNYMNEVTSNGH